MCLYNAKTFVKAINAFSISFAQTVKNSTYRDPNMFSVTTCDLGDITFLGRTSLRLSFFFAFYFGYGHNLLEKIAISF
jgi:hypothetical protein